MQYLAAPGDSERRRVMAAHLDLYHADAGCLLHLERPVEAWVRLESGHARALTESLGLEALAALQHGESAVLELRALQRAVQQADLAFHGSEAGFLAAMSQAEQQAATAARRQARQALEGAHAALQARIATLGLTPPGLDSTALLGLPFAPDTAALTLLLTPETCQALVLYAGTVRSVLLPAPFSLAELQRLVHALPPEAQAWIAAYNARGQARSALEQAQNEAQADLATAQRLVADTEAAWGAALEHLATPGLEVSMGWYWAYRLAYEVVRGANHAPAERATLQRWKQTVEHTLAFLATHLWQPLTAALPPAVTRVLWLPTGRTTLLPVHAAAPAHLTVACTPSLGIWQQCGARSAVPAAAAAPSTLLLATPASDLFFTQAEAEWLRERLAALGHDVTWLQQQQATAMAVATQARGHRLVHFSGHAGYHWEAPLASALACADGPLTLTAMRQQMDLRLARLITLSACSTGLSDVFGSGEEFVGLPAALLEAGAPAVLASLWPVNDISTAFLMDRFYEVWLGAASPSIASALASAAHWLRHATRADLLRRVTDSTLSPAVRQVVHGALETALRQEAARLADDTSLATTVEILSRAETCPFAAPHYWAAFAAWGAVF